VLNVSTLVGANTSRSDSLRYGMQRHGEHAPRSAGARRPVVVWNCTRACNLACAHCYASAKAAPATGELTGDEARALLDDLADFAVPAVLLSGGEPLVRPDLVELLEHGRSRGLRFTLSTNGMLVDDACAERLAAAGLVYAGVSIDGDRVNHDRQRRELGAYDAAVAGLRRLGEHGVRRGVRFTLTPDTIDGIDAVFDLVLRDHIERLCVYHLVPQGRGARLVDVSPDERRAVVERVFAFAVEHPDVEVLTVDNPSDGALLYHWLLGRDPGLAASARAALEWNTGARGGSGVGIGCITECGDVHPDQFSRYRVLGNVRERPFSGIWTDPDDEFVVAARSGARPVPAACAGCADYPICGGGFRARAESATGDPWGADPSCQLVGAGI
jgi:radical SAM protein with 4Fe4S-binding SPASM domain